MFSFRDGETCASVDLLMPYIGEVVGGGQREERLDVLVNLMKLHRLLPASYTPSSPATAEDHQHPYSWYIDLRRHGNCMHSGYGIGFERFVSFMCGVKSVRDVIPFPRYSGQTL